MAIRKIVRVIEPVVDDTGYGGELYRIIYCSPDGIEYPRDVVKSQHDRLVFEQVMISKCENQAPVTIEDIEKYKELLKIELREEAEENQSYDYCPNCGM
ncbi:MAG: hypothetical protein IMZ47_03115 [Firmicutes bacterium]|nr:hypothetical protein [Bacillota bacterium]